MGSTQATSTSVSTFLWALTACICCLLIGRGAVAQEVDPLEALTGIPDEINVRPPMAPVEKPPQEAEPESFGSPDWNAPALAPRQFDWIQLTNGEWLKGEIEFMRSDDLTFESDELGQLTIELEKVATIRTAGAYTFGFSLHRMATGRGLITRNEVIVETESGKEVFARDELYSIVHAQRKWWNLWQGTIGAGITVRQGNTNQIDASLSASIKRRTAFSRFSIDFRGTYGSVDDEATVQNTRSRLALDFFLTNRFFVTPLEVEVYRDEFQNIELQFSPGAGVGYEVFHTKKLEMNIQAGGVYRSTRHGSTEAGQSDVDRTGALTAGTDWEATLTRRVDFDGSYSASIGIPDASDTNQHAVAVLSVEMTSIIDLDVTFSWDRIGQPVGDDQNETPEKDDFRLSVGLAIDF